MQDREVVLYTRAGCHLCDDALDVLSRHGVQPRLVDIDQDTTARELYNECVPVVEIDGKVHFRGLVNEVLLRRLLGAPRMSWWPNNWECSRSTGSRVR